MAERWAGQFFCLHFCVYKSVEISLGVISECLCGYSQICQVLPNKCSTNSIKLFGQDSSNPPSFGKGAEKQQKVRGSLFQLRHSGLRFTLPCKPCGFALLGSGACPQGGKRGLSELALWTALGCYSCHLHLRPTCTHVLCTTAEVVGVAKIYQQLWTIHLRISPNPS